jgi:hypothetical protein
VRLRRALVPLFLVASTALTSCGGDDSGSASDPPTSDPSTSASTSAGSITPAVEPTDQAAGDAVAACDLVSTDEVAAAVGSPVKAGQGTSGPSVTGGSFTSCVWLSDDADHPADTATVTIYDNAAAADSVRSDSSQELTGIGDSAFSDYAASVWVYVGDKSFFAQWYSMEGSDEESLPKSEALARAVVDAL